MPIFAEPARQTLGEQECNRHRKKIRRFIAPNVWKGQDLENDPLLEAIYKTKTQADYLQMLNHLVGQSYAESSLWQAIVGIPYVRTSPISRMLSASTRLPKQKFCSSEYIVGVDEGLLSQLCVGYCYVKALRNQTNHASTDENLSESDKQLLEAYGYDFADLSLKTVKKNIGLAVQAFRKAVEQATR